MPDATRLTMGHLSGLSGLTGNCHGPFFGGAGRQQCLPATRPRRFASRLSYDCAIWHNYWVAGADARPRANSEPRLTLLRQAQDRLQALVTSHLRVSDDGCAVVSGEGADAVTEGHLFLLPSPAAMATPGEVWVRQTFLRASCEPHWMSGSHMI
jgi:hypothetical protein